VPLPPRQNSETAAAGNGTTNKDWWPNQLRVDLLSQHSAKSNPWAKTSTTPKFQEAGL
jgi:catalase-peroxidase